MNCQEELGTDRHPCYSFEAHHKYARMHLPVAPKCNLSCNYCNRKFDCVNESRPGVTSELLTPEEALNRFLTVKSQIPNLSVVGIAGPGDALANWENTRRSIELIKIADPDTIFCLSTNGLLLPKYAEEIVNLGIKHVTVTMNCIDPEIGAKIYRQVIYQGKKYSGLAGASLLLKNQLKGIALLTSKGVLVKVNTVMIKNINAEHIPSVVKNAKALGAFISNIMPLIPAQGSRFANHPQTSAVELRQMQDRCQIDLTQMRHCKQCRADAIGLIGEDRCLEFTGVGRSAGCTGHEAAGLSAGCTGHKAAGRSAGCTGHKAAGLSAAPQKPAGIRIAVATKRGNLVDQHFGYAEQFEIYQWDGKTFNWLEERPVGRYCSGAEECDPEEAGRERLINSLRDCRAVLSMRIGYHAKQRLAGAGILSVETCDTVENGLADAVAQLASARVNSLGQNHGIGLAVGLS